MVTQKELDDIVEEFTRLIPNYIEKKEPLTYLKLINVAFEYKPKNEKKYIDFILEYYTEIKEQKPTWNHEQTLYCVLDNITYSLAERFYGEPEEKQSN